MADVVVTGAADGAGVDVAGARRFYVEALGSTYGAARKYAAALVEYFEGEGYGYEWITMPHDQKGEAGDAMREERDALYADLKKAGHSNPSVKWKQIKGYAAEIVKAANPQPEGEGEGAEGEGEGSGKAKHARSLQLRLVEDLTSLFKACKREGSKMSTGQRDAHTHITSALRALGVDTSSL